MSDTAPPGDPMPPPAAEEVGTPGGPGAEGPMARPDGGAAGEGGGSASPGPEPPAGAPDAGADAASGDAGEVGEPAGGSPDGDAPGEEDLLAAALRQRDDYLRSLQQVQADFENYKKRQAKQQADNLARAAESLVTKLLPALDVADLAVAHGGGEDVKQVWAALVDILEREGLERIEPVGDPFDPTRHDAVAHEPGDGGAQEVAEVLRAGYAWKGRVLRPAMVKVRG